MENEIIERLKKLGFKEYESKVFITLLRGSAMSASEISKESGVIRNSIYDILKSFTEKGYCNEIETNSILKYELIEPEIIFDKIERDLKKKREEEDLNRKQTLSALKSMHKIKDKKNEVLNVELIRGYNAHREEKFIRLVKSAKKEILFMMKFEGNVTDEIDKSVKDFYKRGGKIKSVYEYNLEFKVIDNDKWKSAGKKDFIDILKVYEKAGEEIRISEEPVPALTIFDGETVFLSISDRTLPRHQEADIIIRNKDFANNLIYIFNTYFNKSKSINNFLNSEEGK